MMGAGLERTWENGELGVLFTQRECDERRRKESVEQLSQGRAIEIS